MKSEAPARVRRFISTKQDGKSKLHIHGCTADVQGLRTLTAKELGSRPAPFEIEREARGRAIRAYSPNGSEAGSP